MRWLPRLMYSVTSCVSTVPSARTTSRTSARLAVGTKNSAAASSPTATDTQLRRLRIRQLPRAPCWRQGHYAKWDPELQTLRLLATYQTSLRTHPPVRQTISETVH